MPVTVIPTFSAAEIVEWQKEKERLTGVISESQQRLYAVNQLLSAAKVLAGKRPEEDAKTSEPAEVETEQIDPTNFMGTIAKIVNSTEKTLSKKELKAALIAAGVPEERVKSAYFYVALDRLYGHHRITLYEDGTVGKATAEAKN